MTAIEPGAIVMCRQTQTQLWVVVRSAAPEGSWHCRAKRIDQYGRHDTTSRIIGQGDLVLVRAAPNFSAGEAVAVGGVEHEVVCDLGEQIELVAPEVSRPLPGGNALRMAAGNIRVNKADLVLEGFG